MLVADVQAPEAVEPREDPFRPVKNHFLDLFTLRVIDCRCRPSHFDLIQTVEA